MSVRVSHSVKNVSELQHGSCLQLIMGNEQVEEERKGNGENFNKL